MPLPNINLDDRTSEDLFQELRRRLPTYTPEWTDHNDSDPGITLMQVFAWLAEMMVWRLNRVPEKNFIKFLELVGLDLQQPAPAVTELQFTLVKGTAPERWPIVPAGTQVALGASSSGPPVIFETDAELTVVGLKLASVQSFDASQFTSYTDANGLDGPPGYPPLSNTPQNNAALYLGFDFVSLPSPVPSPPPPPFPPGQHRLTVHVSQGDVPATVVGGADPLASVSPPVEAYWEYWAGDQNQWERLQIIKDTTFALTKNGYITFQAPTDAQTRKVGLLTKPDDSPIYWLRYRIQNVLGPGYETPPLLEGILLNTVSATNSVTEREELLGASNGRPNQTFQLAKFPVLPLDPGVTGNIAVDEGDGTGFLTWKEVNDFAASGPSDKHYTLNHSTGLVSFGDGVHGKIPRWQSGNGSNRDDADIPNVKATSYRWGGGSQANSGANTITTLLAAIPFVQSVTNPRPSIGGADEETVQHAEDRAPMTLRTSNRAVTPEDFAFLATQTPGAQIERAQAFPLLNPNFRLVRSAADGMPKVPVPIPGAVTVVVVPSSTLAKPVPTEGTLQLVANWLDKHRLLTCELFVAEPRYREVRIEVQVIAEPMADLGVVHDAVLKRLLNYFNPLRPGGSDGRGWDFGGTIYFSETYRQIFDVDGVSRIITGTAKTYLDQMLQVPCTDIQLEPDELVFSLDHGIQVTYS
jgi:predicted phage baseplate assembly protein